MADFTETERGLFVQMCRAADTYQDGMITGDEFRSFVVDFTDAVKIADIVEPPFNAEHYYSHTPAGPNPECVNCAYLNWSQP